MPRANADSRNRRRMNATSCSRPCSFARHTSSSRASSMRSQRSGPALVPLGQDVTREEIVHLRRHPGQRVDAVGDRRDRRLLLRHVRPQVGEHVAAHLTVQLRHGVRPAREPQSHDGHVEALVGRVAGPMPERHQLVDRDAALLRPRAEVLVDELPRKAVDAGGHRRVGGEDVAGPHRFDGLRVAQPVVHDRLPDAFEAEEAGVALVGVEHLRLDAERLQRADAADAEQDLLAQAVLDVAAVETVGHLTQVVRVLLHVRVEEIQRHPTDVGAPHRRAQRQARDVDLDPHAVDGGQGHRVGVEIGVALLLPTVDRQLLAEVTVAVEQADADERNAEIRCGLEMVAGEHAEAARVLRQRLGDAELGREVRDRSKRGADRRGPGTSAASTGSPTAPCASRRENA